MRNNTDRSTGMFKAIPDGLVILILGIVAILVYSNTLSTPFVFDDVIHITGNPYIRLQHFTMEGIKDAALKGYARNRPVPMMSFALNYYFHRYNVFGYQLVNIIIHMMTGIFLYLFIKITLWIIGTGIGSAPDPSFDRIYNNRAPIAFLATLIWLVHPVQTQSVTYIVQRMNSMAAMFFILSILLYAKGRSLQEKKFCIYKPEVTYPEPPKNRTLPEETTDRISEVDHNKPATYIKRPFTSYLWFTGSFLAGIMALFSKEISLTLPFLIFLYEWYFFQGLSKTWIKQRLLLFAIVLTGLAAVAFFYLGANPLKGILSGYDLYDFTLKQRVLTEFRVVIFYISLILFPLPARLNLDHDFSLSNSLIEPLTTLPSLAVIIGLTALALYIAKKERLYSFCILWFFGNLVIESSIIGIEIIYEHRIYLPSMLVCLLVVIFAYKHIRLKWVKVALLCGIVMVFSIWTYERNSVWKDEITLWEDCVKKSPASVRSLSNLASNLYIKGKFEEAAGLLKNAVRLDPDDEKVHVHLGNVFFAQGNRDQAIDHYRKALKLYPAYDMAHINLGSVLLLEGRIQEAVVHFEEALRINNFNDQAHSNLAKALLKAGKTQEAVIHFKKAIRINPDNVAAYNNLKKRNLF